MNKRLLLFVATGCLVGAAAPAVIAAQDGTLMDLTMRVTESVAGLPPISPRTVHKRLCAPAGAFDAMAFAHPGAPGSCKTEHYAKNGQRVTFDLICTRPVPLTSHGSFHLDGGQNFTGSLHTSFIVGGHAATFDTDYVGRQAGTCAYSPPAAR